MPENLPPPRKGIWEKAWLHLLLAFAFWSALLFAFVMAIMATPGPLQPSVNDKVNHILAFAVLSVLAAIAYPRANLIKIFVGLVIFGAMIELVQAIPALKRDADLMDLLADAISSGICLSVIAGVRRLWRPRPGNSDTP